MTGSQTYQRLTREILEEHQQIHFYLDQIMAALGGLTDDPTDVEPMRRLAARVESVRERLAEHHQREEQRGMYSAIQELLPQARAELSELRRQHEKMIEVLELARIHAQYGEPSEAADLRTDLERFLQMIRDHERAEEALLERAIAKETQSQT